MKITRKNIGWFSFIITLILLLMNYIMAYYPPKDKDMVGGAVIITIAFAIISLIYLFQAQVRLSVESGSPAYGEIGIEIFKDPVTDDGTKKSARGLLHVGDFGDRGYILSDQVDWESEGTGALQVIFEDGKFYNETTLTQIRERLDEKN